MQPDIGFIVLGLGADPRIFKDLNGTVAQEPTGGERPILTYPQQPDQYETGWEPLDKVLAVLKVFSDFLEFYLPFV